MQAKILIVVEWVTLLPRIFVFQGSNSGPELSLCIFSVNLPNAKNNSTKPPASGAGNIGDAKLISQVGRVREIACA